MTSHWPQPRLLSHGLFKLFLFLLLADLTSPPFLLISLPLSGLWLPVLTLILSPLTVPCLCHQVTCLQMLTLGLSHVPGLPMHSSENLFTAALKKFPSWFETLLAWIDFPNYGGKPKMYKGSLFSEFISLNFSEWMWVCWKLRFLRTA
jgi:hypothetical protein